MVSKASALFDSLGAPYYLYSLYDELEDYPNPKDLGEFTPEYAFSSQGGQVRGGGAFASQVDTHHFAGSPLSRKAQQIQVHEHVRSSLGFGKVGVVTTAYYDQQEGLTRWRVYVSNAGPHYLEVPLASGATER